MYCATLRTGKSTRHKGIKIYPIKRGFWIISQSESLISTLVESLEHLWLSKKMTAVTLGFWLSRQGFPCQICCRSIKTTCRRVTRPIAQVSNDVFSKFKQYQITFSFIWPSLCILSSLIIFLKQRQMWCVS